MRCSSASSPSHAIVNAHTITSYFAGNWLVWAQFTPAADAGGWFDFHSTFGINTSIAIASMFGPALAAVVVVVT